MKDTTVQKIRILSRIVSNKATDIINIIDSSSRDEVVASLTSVIKMLKGLDLPNTNYYYQYWRYEDPDHRFITPVGPRGHTLKEMELGGLLTERYDGLGLYKIEPDGTALHIADMSIDGRVVSL